MKNKIRGILLLILAAVFMFMGVTANAESVINEDGVINTVYIDENSSVAIAEINLMNPNETGISLYGQYLAYGTSSIENLGSGNVHFQGDTTCFGQSDQVIVAVSLQRKVGNSWQTYATRTGVAYNASNASAGDTIAVSRGYYYRVKGVHTVQEGSLVESTTTYTRDFYIG